MSDPEIVRAWLGRDHPAAAHVIAERDRRYRARTADGSTVPETVRAAVRLAARARAGRHLLGRGAQRDRGHTRAPRASRTPST